MKGRHVLLGAWLCLATGGVVLPTACGTVQPGDGSSSTVSVPADAATVLSIEDALAAEPGRTIRVSGAVVAVGSDVLLASVLEESYPPQAGGARLPLSGLDLESLVGLSSTADQPELNQVTWSDYWVVLGGLIKDGVLEVRETPRVVEAVSASTRIRFSPVNEPLVSQAPVWWAFDVKNEGTEPIDLTFSSGQKADIILSRDGVEKYRWSAAKAFTQAIETVTVAPGWALPVVLNDTLGVAPGGYDLTAVITASIRAPSGGTALPQLKTSVTVH